MVRMNSVGEFVSEYSQILLIRYISTDAPIASALPILLKPDNAFGAVMIGMKKKVDNLIARLTEL
ncbi:MAG TPA: hypothetical protein DD473_19850 [Planctomycetaceae bacterium]|nr:hypothetical protein [Planctomycetaceae bacterium]